MDVKVDVVTRIEQNMLSWFGHGWTSRFTSRFIWARPRRTLRDRIGDVLEKGLVKNIRNRRGCLRRLMCVDEAEEIRQARGEWNKVVSSYHCEKEA